MGAEPCVPHMVTWVRSCVTHVLPDLCKEGNFITIKGAAELFAAEAM